MFSFVGSLAEHTKNHADGGLCPTDGPRWGLRRAAKMARKAGWKVNNKRIRRLWREGGLRVPQRRKKKRLTGIGVQVGAMSPIRPNVIWAMDFQFDTTAHGRTLKMLNVIVEFTREALAIEVDRSIDADGVHELDGGIREVGHLRRFDAERVGEAETG